MSILIKGMEMPRACLFCPIFNGEYSECELNENIQMFDGGKVLYEATQTRHKDCPLVEVNDQEKSQGDLISREALKNEYAEKCAGECDCCLYNDHYDGCNLINNAPTIGKGSNNDED